MEEKEEENKFQPYSIGMNCRDCGAPIVSHGRLYHRNDDVPEVLSKLTHKVAIDEEEHWYFCPANTVYDDCLMFQAPSCLREGDWNGDGVEVISSGKSTIVIEKWQPPTTCGCIIPKAEEVNE